MLGPWQTGNLPYLVQECVRFIKSPTSWHFMDVRVPTPRLRDTRAWMGGNPNSPGILLAFVRYMDFSDRESATLEVFTSNF